MGSPQDTGRGGRRRGGFNSSWVFTLLIVVAFFLFEHRATPEVPLPAHYTKVGNAVRIPVGMGVPSTNGESWTLAKVNQQNYVVLLTNNSKTLHQYKANPSGHRAADGTNFAVAGAVNLDGTLYQAQTLHVNPDGRTGYIQFKPAAAAVNNTANTSPQGSANGTAAPAANGS